jgi:Na+-transporting methylmalonyl-CoA/oxaloacetate decarboxylase beta subunit
MMVGGTLIALAVIKQYEPVLLRRSVWLPPKYPTHRHVGWHNGLWCAHKGRHQHRALSTFNFVGVGAMIDFSPYWPNLSWSCWGSGPIWDFRHIDAGDPVRFSAQ